MKQFLKRTSIGLLAAGALIIATPASADSRWKSFSNSGGQLPVPLELHDMAGRPVALAAMKGEVVLVNFWATWCEPCRDEIPSLNRLQQKFADKGFRVLGVNVGEGRARIEQFSKRIPIEFAVLRDADSAITKAWRVRVLPASFLVDKNGMLRYQLLGDADWDNPALQAPILELLK